MAMPVKTITIFHYPTEKPMRKKETIKKRTPRVT